MCTSCGNNHNFNTLKIPQESAYASDVRETLERVKSLDSNFFEFSITSSTGFNDIFAIANFTLSRNSRRNGGIIFNGIKITREAEKRRFPKSRVGILA